jgi:dUTPase
MRSREDVDFNIVDELNETDRGSGGFGHTGKK